MDSVSVNMNLARMADLPETIRSRLETDGIVRSGGRIYYRAGGQVLACEEGDAGEAIIRALQETEKDMGTFSCTDDPWQAILNGDIRKTRQASGIRDGIRRCLIRFETLPDQEKSLTPAVWNEMVPLERGDAVTGAAPGSITLIKQAEGHTEEEIAEYAAAVIETINTETGIQVRAGIGQITSELAGLQESRRQASRAIAIGTGFHPEERVYIYSRQILERLISAIPEDTRAQLRRELFSGETEKKLTPEMMETIRAFFRNDLNLSTTARQLFIHRNTLIYRLDKIRKETGFDLRRFQDAAAFQMISRIPDE